MYMGEPSAMAFALGRPLPADAPRIIVWILYQKDKVAVLTCVKLDPRLEA